MIKCEQNLLGLCLKFSDNFDKLLIYKNLFEDLEIIHYFELAKQFKEKNKSLKLFESYIIENNLDISTYLEIIEDIIVEGNFEYYLKQVLTRKIKREIRGAVAEFHGNKDYIDISIDIQEIIDNNVIVNDSEITQAKDICRELLLPEEDNKITSCIDTVDSSQGGFEPGEFIIIAARPSVGKTSLIIDLIRRQLREDIHIGLITCEMKKKKIIRLLACDIAGLNETKFTVKHSGNVDKQKYLNAVEWLYTKEFYIDESGYFEDIKRKIKIMICKKKVQCVYIDHLHHILSYKTYKFEREKLQHIVLSLKEIAMQYNIPIILAAQLNRGAENTENTVPKCKDIKGCGDAEQIADIVVLLHKISVAENGDYSRRTVDIIIDKNRNGQVGVERKIFFPQTRRFENYYKGEGYGK